MSIYSYVLNESYSGDRKSIVKKLDELAKKAIATAAKEFPKVKKSFWLASADDDYKDFYLDDFLSGSENTIPVIKYDAWEYCDGNARNQGKYEEFGDAYAKVIDTFRALIKDSSISHAGKVGDGGDWDDGAIEFTLRK